MLKLKRRIRDWLYEPDPKADELLRQWSMMGVQEVTVSLEFASRLCYSLWKDHGWWDQVIRKVGDLDGQMIYNVKITVEKPE